MKPIAGRILDFREQGPVFDQLALQRNPVRDRVILLLSLRGGLTATEIASLKWEHLIDDRGRLRYRMLIVKAPGQQGLSRSISLLNDLRQAVQDLKGRRRRLEGPVILTNQGGPMTRDGIVRWFRRFYDAAGLPDCSSRTGKITKIVVGIRVSLMFHADLDGLRDWHGHKTTRSLRRYADLAKASNPTVWAYSIRNKAPGVLKGRWWKR